MDRGDLTVTQVTDFVLKLQYVFCIVVISETVMSTKVMQEDPRILFFFFFFVSKSQLRRSFTRLLQLHEKFARDEKFSQ